MKIISIIILHILLSSQIMNASAFSRYYGYLHHESLQVKQKAQLDFITFRGEDNKLNIQAFLKVFFGKEGTHEYITYHYHNVYYNVLKNTLFFSEEDQNISFQTLIFKDGIITADTYSSTNGYIGKLKLNQKKPIRNNGIGSITGLYKSHCENKNRFLYLYTYRNDESFSALGSPFYSYSIKGQISEAGSFSCQKDQFCITKHFDSGNYNFFDASLSLSSNKNILDCTIINSSSLQCGLCLYQRIPDSASKKPLLKVLNHTKNTSQLKISEGNYSGFIKLNENDTNKNFSLNIHSFQDKSTSLLNIKSSFFIGSEKGERISFQFQKEKAQIMKNSLFFENTIENPFMMHMTQMYSDKIEGDLYNKYYGYYGHFSVQKNSTLPIKNLPGIEGAFYSDTYHMDLGTLENDSIQDSSNPFRPYTFYGSIIYKSKFQHRVIPITGGSFDIQTGRLALELDNNTRIATGTVSQDQNTINLKIMSNGIGTLDQNKKEIVFRRKNAL